MPAAFSVEGRIASVLNSLQCSQRNFIAICKSKGVQISAGGFSEAMTDTRPFDRSVGLKLLEIAGLMLSTQDYFNRQVPSFPLDWSKSDQIAMLLTLTLLREVAAQEGFVELAQNAEYALNEEGNQ